MQIHEITQRRVNEGYKGLWNKGMALANYYAGDYATSAEYSQKELQRQGRNPESDADPTKSWTQKYTDLDKTPGMTGYINGLAQEWFRSPDAKPTTPAPRAKPGQMPADVANSAQGKKMQQAYGTPSGGIQGMQSDLEEASPMDPAKLAQMKQRARTPVPTTTTTTPTKTTPTKTTAAPTDYIGKFQAWADKELATKVQGVYGAVATMDNVRKDIPELVKKLDSALQQVANTQNTDKHTAAIQEYLKLASAGIQAVGQKQRYDATKAKYKPGDTSDATNQLGLTDRQVQGLKALAQTPAGKAQLIKDFKDLGIV